MAQQQIDALVAFQRRSVALGNKISPGRHWRAELCASLACSFAVAINKGKRLKPQSLLTDRECALVWIAAVATDAATREIGEDFEKALLVTPIWLFEGSAIERGLHAIGEAKAIHNRIASGPAAGFATAIGKAFVDWAFLNDDRGVEVLEEYMEETAVLVNRQRF